MGQKAKLTRQSTFLDSFGRVKTSLHASGVELEVIAVEPRQALLKPKQQADMANIQNQDLVIFNP